MKILLPLLLALPHLALGQGPVFHWPLDEVAGTVAHAWGGPDGTLVGGVTWAPTAGHHQGCARFDGVDDRIVLGPCDITSGTGGITVSLWAKADFVTGMDRTLIAKATGPDAADHIWSIAFVSGTRLRFRLKAGGTAYAITTPPSSLFGGQWYHLVGTYDGTQMRLYLNGALMGSAAASGLIGLHPQSPAAVGALSTGTQPFSGWIDDVRIFDRALSAAEVMELLMATMTTAIPTAVDRTAAPSIPNGRHRLTMVDALGRVLSNSLVDGPAPLPAAPEGAGPVLIMLDGPEGRLAWKRFTPASN